MTGVDVHIVYDERATQLKRFGRIAEIYENGWETVASVYQYKIVRRTAHLVDNIARFGNNEPNVAGIYACRSAIGLNSISECIFRHNASMVATVGRENDRAQATAGFKSLHAWFETAI
jgi:hypothetical protein